LPFIYRQMAITFQPRNTAAVWLLFLLVHSSQAFFFCLLEKANDSKWPAPPPPPSLSPLLLLLLLIAVGILCSCFICRRYCSCSSALHTRGSTGKCGKLLYTLLLNWCLEMENFTTHSLLSFVASFPLCVSQSERNRKRTDENMKVLQIYLFIYFTTAGISLFYLSCERKN